MREGRGGRQEAGRSAAVARKPSHCNAKEHTIDHPDRLIQTSFKVHGARFLDRQKKKEAKLDMKFSIAGGVLRGGSSEG